MRTQDGQLFFTPPNQADAYKELRDIHGQIHTIAGEYWNWPSVATLTRPTLARILNLNFLYDEMLPVAGSICEFGVHYGSSLATLLNLRAIKEPYNYSRHIFGFDTFSGFAAVDEKDGALVKSGDFHIDDGYENLLDRLLQAQESLSPNNHLKKYSLIKGDASVTSKKWLEENPHSLISMAIFDMDVYKPTKDVLEAIKPRLSKGSIIVFDELNCPHFPGETQALLEVFDMNSIEVKRSPFLPYTSYFRL
ncbi:MULTISPECIES: crotonobetainyl-CoA--carnitine CoA-transferase [Pseudomonas]|uniref:Crotonobetainyl-CoA--carnitine CoA-transferase n=1 Tax=Pseudomonas lini TaxID=163011 RepID=A0A0J6HFV5_9PSED|nr:MULTISPECIES: crotonobetainyl-CoA--carnitine CoA-transferase [Pseudomonas]KAB0503448.1 crotonobetainyl-CoA--carnitine CoA-transferase [Pseudomonas lini]KMM93124.1 crotonobetainyl-CoA:carnitine CoA-transferase [Pseudomonas lini]KNH48018.1 crotonobetainyl-CoA:carnitine CoA-transferase [Pseudomonas lini]MDT9678510.1 crotonobetainyl-CoA--carnitine CoA-transferase [Pseudomonas sp. JV414]NSX08265.1 crotonobetainyl-CoA--carnitine CoA-transferase [Pseudomonas lini]